MARQKRVISTAKRQAAGLPHINAKPKASGGPAADDRASVLRGPTPRAKKRMARAAAANAARASGDKEAKWPRVAGTRIEVRSWQGRPLAVRVVAEDGKEFPP
eukprot:CAMPEP_0179290412 /NCGR_PEP_ID=MMETSP0797-20121207/41802_1 /TAXON_ID=47934 /ORGANISM="Dinophysis acuminata, Strain DAEP01" /LENGTH=102 /DNA_ID=CAMNT_0020999443 /DNA_START=13 /DNA_END=317 /DNA_ORIENTATION=-